MPLNTLFLAFKPPAAIASSMHDAASAHAAGRTNKAAHPTPLLHMTLVSLGGFPIPPEKTIKKIQRILDDASASPIPVVLDQSALFGKRQSLALTCTTQNRPLMKLAKGLHQTFRHHGLLPLKTVSFTPHVTLVYGCGDIDLVPVQQPFRWIAEEMSLIYSHNGQTRHEEFGSWRLSPHVPLHFPMPEQLNLTL